MREREFENIITPEDKEFKEYMDQAYHEKEDPNARVKPARYWRDETVDLFHGENSDPGVMLPFAKTQNKIKFRKGDTTIWGGVNGHGKSQMLNLATLAFMSQGERCLIISPEMKPKRNLARMARQYTGDRVPIISSIDGFYDWAEDKLWMYDQTGTVKHWTIKPIITYCYEKLGITQIVIDSLMKLGIAPDDYNTQALFTDEMCTLGRDLDIHIHIVHHSKKRESEHKVMSTFDYKGAGEITDMADNVISVFRNKKKEDVPENERGEDWRDDPDAKLSVDKQRNGDWIGRVRLWFDPDSLQFLQTNSSNKKTPEYWKENPW